MPTMTKLLVGTVALSTALSVQAGSLQRGYESCADRIYGELRGTKPKLSKAYYVSHDGDQRHYYINATAWREKVRQPMRSECITPLSGRRVLAVSIAPGRFTNVRPGNVDIEEASD